MEYAGVGAACLFQEPCYHLIDAHASSTLPLPVTCMPRGEIIPATSMIAWWHWPRSDMASETTDYSVHCASFSHPAQGTSPIHKNSASKRGSRDLGRYTSSVWRAEKENSRPHFHPWHTQNHSQPSTEHRRSFAVDQTWFGELPNPLPNFHSPSFYSPRLFIAAFIRFLFA
jgi:hypothetical protein